MKWATIPSIRPGKEAEINPVSLAGRILPARQPPERQPLTTSAQANARLLSYNPLSSEITLTQVTSEADLALEESSLYWLNVEHPTASETALLGETFPFHQLDLEDCLSDVQRPKVDVYADYFFVVMHFPIFSKVSRRMEAAEIDFFIGPHYVVTLHDGRLKPLDLYFERCRAGDESFRRGSGYVFYGILDRMIDYCFPIIDKIGAKILRMEASIFETQSLQSAREILEIKREILTYRRIVKPQRTAIGILEHKEMKFLGYELDVYFGDLGDHMARLWDLLENYKELVEGLHDTQDSLMTQRTNSIIKTLTMMSGIILPLTLLVSLYSMNVPLPGRENPLAFWFIAAAMFSLLMAMLVFFRWRRWL